MAGKSPINRGVNRKITDFYGPFSIATSDYKRVMWGKENHPFGHGFIAHSSLWFNEVGPSNMVIECKKKWGYDGLQFTSHQLKNNSLIAK